MASLKELSNVKRALASAASRPPIATPKCWPGGASRRNQPRTGEIHPPSENTPNDASCHRQRASSIEAASSITSVQPNDRSSETTSWA